MLKMKVPSISYDEVLTEIENVITGNPTLKSNLQGSRTELGSAAKDYSSRANNATLFELQRVLTNTSKVIGELDKDNLVSLYEYYFRDKKCGGIYEKLLHSADEKCPFCGGIGLPKNLDHFMPKSAYPQFAVLPVNLIPACRDCNMGNKGTGFAATHSEQILHPFLDADHFFNEQWIFAKYCPAQSGKQSSIEYSVSPPKTWSEQDQDRVLRHFSDFKIGDRYGIRAATDLAEIENQVHRLRELDYAIDFREIILTPIVNVHRFANHWKRVMCIALIEQMS